MSTLGNQRQTKKKIVKGTSINTFNIVYENKVFLLFPHRNFKFYLTIVIFIRYWKVTGIEKKAMIESLITFRVNLDASRLGLIDFKNKIKVKGHIISK